MNIKQIQSGEYRAEIDTLHGANCISLRSIKYNIPILREFCEANGQKKDNPFLYGMPILFPVNRISNGRFVFEGRTYSFPINEAATGCHLHGSIHNLPFEVKEHSERHIKCTFNSEGKHPYPGFPHEFEIDITYTIGADGLKQTVEIKNLSDLNMPCMLGFHTTFDLSSFQRKNVKVKVGTIKEFGRDMSTYLPNGTVPSPDDITLNLNNGTFDPFSKPISRHYLSDKEGIMSISDTEHGICIVYENDTKYRFRLIYNGNADGYICLEPQTCMVNAPNEPYDMSETGFDCIKPHSSNIYSSHIYIKSTEIEEECK